MKHRGKVVVLFYGAMLTLNYAIEKRKDSKAELTKDK